MYIYNVTTNIDQAVHKEWISWMKKVQIPNVLATGKFTNAKMCRVLVDEEMGGVTYSVQYTTTNKETLEQYYLEDATVLRQASLQKFPNKFVSFRTELEIISEH